MKRAFLLLPALAFCATAYSQQVSTLQDLVRDDWAGEFWNDGKAEVATYNGERVIYGEPREHTHRLITVSEDFNREYWVKADWPYGNKPILPVVKQNQVATIETPNYPYHYMVSVFFDRTDLDHAVKMSVSSQEWCGTTFKEFQLYRPNPVMEYNSYWDGQGTGDRNLPRTTRNVFFEEELPLLVRTLEFSENGTARFGLQPNQTTSKAPPPSPSPAVLKIERPDHARETALGTLSTSQLWDVAVQAEDGREIEFLIEAEYPNRLLEYRFSDGRAYELEDIRRWAYWQIQD